MRAGLHRAFRFEGIRGFMVEGLTGSMCRPLLYDSAEDHTELEKILLALAQGRTSTVQA